MPSRLLARTLTDARLQPWPLPGVLGIGSPYATARAPARNPAKDGEAQTITPCMREVVFRVLVEQPGLLTAQADDPSVRIEAPSLEELHHEAREALIQHFGPAHSAFRVRIRRNRSQPVSGIRPMAPGSTCLR